MPVEITNQLAPPSRGAPTSIDSLFVPAAIEIAGLPLDRAVTVRSLSDYIAQGGSRDDNQVVYDGLDNFFRERGKQAHIARYTEAGTITSALPNFVEGLGGGQVVAWDEPAGAATQAILQDFAEATKRYALHDVGVDDDTVAELSAVAATIPVANNDYAAAFGPWVEIPAPPGVYGGDARQVPASSTVAALIARGDALGNPNIAPAGRDFLLQYATDVLGPPLSDADAATLRAAGLNPLREKFGLLVLDGFQTSRDQNADDPFWQANPGRARMWLQWQATATGLQYEYKTIDGRGRLAGALKTDLEAICKRLWEANGLFGDSPQEAYRVEVGTSVNTVDSIAQGELNAVVEARLSLHAQLVRIALVSVPITGQITA